ncbi:MAG TPA: ABC transporter [Nitrospirae bacterium]|nr:inner membrane transport permease YadH [bacterium BMS3Abin06]HDH12717.1 ABC transporter [Nitrospirota bacterium]HDZ00026.1 ABC transporter [Nitrospirota bacterium]
MNWYPVFYREMLLFKKKLCKLGYVFSSLLFPVLYLVAFGMGLGRRVNIEGTGYIEFLIPGIAAMTSMTNSYNLVSNSLSMGRLFFKSFQVVIQSPLPHFSIMTGIVFSGIVKGALASAVIVLAGLIIFRAFPFSLVSFLGLLLNLILFSSMGVVAGLLIRYPEDNAIYTNFFIMPMAFFSGTFFPVDNLPAAVKGIIMFLPLHYTNILIRSDELSKEVILPISVLLAVSITLFLCGAKLIKNYSE